MSRTKAEIIAFADRQVGTIPQHPQPYPGLSGQCVTGVKILLNFLGVPDPFAARGNAKDVGDTLIRQGIGTAGKGSILTVVVNRDMGNIYEPSLGRTVNYGHIWFEIMGYANYESNGNRALYMTKNTRPLSQGQQYINLDKWVTGETQAMIIQNANNWRGRVNRTVQAFWGRNFREDEFLGVVGKDTLTLLEILGDNPETDNQIYRATVGRVAINDNWQGQIESLQAQIRDLGSRPTQAQLDELKKAAADFQAQTVAAKQDAAAARAEAKKLSDQAAIDRAAGESILRRIGILLGIIKQ